MKHKNKSSIAWSDSENPINLDVVLMGKKTFHPEELAQHTLIIGGTGSGKTTSGVKPLINGFWRYVSKHGDRYAMLVVDPKCELADFLLEKDAQEGASRVEVLLDGGSSDRFDPFEGVDELESFADKMESAFNMFEGNQAFSGDNAVFRESALGLLRDLASIEEAVFKESGKSVFSLVALMFAPKIEAPNFIDGIKVFSQLALATTIRKEDGLDLAGVGLTIDDMAKKKMCLSDEELTYSFKEPLEVSVFDGLLALIRRYAPSCEWMYEPLNVYAVEVYKKGHKDHLKQFGYYVAYWNNLISVFSDKRFKAVFDLSLSMHPQPVKRLGALLDMQKTLVLTPRVGVTVDEFIVKIIKRGVFKHMLNRENKLTPMAYIADEFQNFITSDEETGDQNFLDRCRSYRVSCVLATQSLAALQERVLRQSYHAGHAALMSMLINLNNRMIFATKDTETVSMLKGWIGIPQTWSKGHVVDNFPPAALGVGQYYWLRGAQWSRDQVVLPETEQLHSPQMGLA